MSPRIVTRTRTPVLTDDNCPGLTEIKDVRVHNSLLEEIFNVEDTIELDYFELERQEANFDTYLTGYNSPSNARTPMEVKHGGICTGRGTGVESDAYLLHELQCQKLESGDSVAYVSRPKQTSVARGGTYDSEGSELVAVASPTVSSTCEGGSAGSAANGVGNNIPSNSPNDVAVSDSVLVHSTTNVSGKDLTPSSDSKTLADGNRLRGKELSSADEKLPLVTELVSGYGTRTNVRPRAEHRSRNVDPLLQTGGVNAVCQSPSADVAGDPVVLTSSSGGLARAGDSTTASSSSTSPSQLHISKRQRVIDCGSDLLAEVRQTYEYVQGADLYAPSSHPTFTSLDVASLQSAFQPNTDKSGQPQMNFNFSGQTGNAPMAFVGSSRMGDRYKGGAALQGAVMPQTGSRTASPCVTYQSCPDLASPGRQQVPVAVAYSRFVAHRLPTDEAAAASLSAPTTPSKRAGPWSANAPHLRSPVSPSVQTPARHWRPGVTVTGEYSLPVPLSQQTVMTNSGQNMSNMTVRVSRDVRGVHRENSCDPYVWQCGPYSRPQSPVTGPEQNRAVFHNTDGPRSCYTQPPPDAFQRREMLASRGLVISDADRIDEGTPLSQNAFIRSVVDDGSLVFRSHPLYPLLRDVVIADMNFHTPSFPFQLIANLPSDFSRLVQNYLQRNPRLASVGVSDPHAESVVMDALAYAHAALIGGLS